MSYSQKQLSSSRGRRLLAIATVVLSLIPAALHAVPQPPLVRLARDLTRIPVSSLKLGQVKDTSPFLITFGLPWRNSSQLDDLLKHLYTPGDPLYRHFLTSTEFDRRFAPTQTDYAAVVAFAQSRGLSIVSTTQDRQLLNVSGSASVVEAAFGVHLFSYKGLDGRFFYAPDVGPALPRDIAVRVSCVLGLDNLGVLRHSGHPALPTSAEYAGDSLAPYVIPGQIGTDPHTSSLTPANIRTAYHLPGGSLNGAGQAIALAEFDGFTTSDVTTYESYYGLPTVPLTTYKLFGYDGSAGINSNEVVLDIEMVLALAPGLSRVFVYETANGTYSGPANLYNQIAMDNSAKVISTSWTNYESQVLSVYLEQENTTFKKMAAQGQSMFSDSGDNGAYYNNGLSVNDPASQPFVTGVGGTRLYTAFAGGPWSSEVAWYGSGGGLSGYWPLPSYQQQITVGGTTPSARCVPDVALNADITNSGYSYYHGAWTVGGGTSASAPLWAAFTALVNQQRQFNGLGPLGFANPPLYAIAQSGNYAADFHDITSGTNPGPSGSGSGYSAAVGYDLTTGWGSFNGANLLTDLAPVRFDFDQTGYPGILWLNSTLNEGVVWNTSGPNADGSLTTDDGKPWLTGVTGPWTIVGVADADGDGQPDYLWYNSTSQSLAIWDMVAPGDKDKSYGTSFTGPGSGWQAASFTDINGDGHPDILWYNPSPQQLMVWYTDGKSVTTKASAFPITNTAGWQLVGTADYDSDGHPDLLWYNSSQPLNGQLTIWYSQYSAQNGFGIRTYGVPFKGPGNAQWLPVGTGDYNIDGHPDILWYNTHQPSQQQLTVWYTNGQGGDGQTQIGIIKYGYYFPGPNDPNWQVVGVH